MLCCAAVLLQFTFSVFHLPSIFVYNIHIFITALRTLRVLPSHDDDVDDDGSLDHYCPCAVSLSKWWWWIPSSSSDFYSCCCCWQRQLWHAATKLPRHLHRSQISISSFSYFPLFFFFYYRRAPYSICCQLVLSSPSWAIHSKLPHFQVFTVSVYIIIIIIIIITSS